MKNFLRPTKQKIKTSFVLFALAVVFVVMAYFITEDAIAIPIMMVFGGIPIRLFDFITGGIFRPHNCGFLCFPTLPQVSFILVFDIAFLYLIACAISSFRARGTNDKH